LILAGLLVVSVLLVPSVSARAGRNHQKRAAAPSPALTTALSNAITTLSLAAIFAPQNVIPDIFNVVVAGINLGFNGADSKLNTQIDNLINAISTLVQDAVAGNDINDDINTVICDAEQIGGVPASQCVTQTLDTTIQQLVTDASATPVVPATIVSDAFAIVTSALDLAAQISGVSLTPEENLINAICQLVVDCLNGSIPNIANDIGTIVAAATAI